MADRKDRIILHWKKVAFKGWFLVPGEYTGRLDGPELEVELAVSEEEKGAQPAGGGGDQPYEKAKWQNRPVV